MERRKFIQSSLITTSALAAGQLSFAGVIKAAKKELYEWREYELHFGGNHNIFHQYLEKALIPALNKQGIKNVGVFGEIGKSDPAKIYVLIAYPSFEDYMPVNNKLKSDEEFIKSSAAYVQVPAEKPLYNRIKTSLLVAFDGLPAMKLPGKGQRIFEVRTYEGYSEDAVRRKIKMFNDEEFTIFYRTKLNPVFFGEAIAGDALPCLTYMLHFSSMEERDRNWAAFSADADWKRVLADPQYANTVSNIRRVFLEPLPYSQI
mgnify:CR=1 FL=1|jgi:NIPSNAP.